ncbi:MAG: Rid family detoxifying hydrolase [Saprospiraceae bacterium]|nr:Rid family detoxifying hydrolase [Saprospiraceae bacterium]
MIKYISTENAPAAIGPYSQATVFNNVLYVSGQIPINPKTGELIQSNIEDETHQVLNNLKAIIEAAGGSMNNILKCSVFVKDISNFAAINAVYATYFVSGAAPARELVEVANLPRYVNIEISAIVALV